MLHLKFFLQTLMLVLRQDELFFLILFEKVDIWALGVVLFSMVTGEFPWRGSDIQAQLRHATKGVYVTPEFLSKGNVFMN